MTWLLLLFLPGPFEPIASKDFSKEVQSKVCMATVRISTGGYGVIVRQEGKTVYVLTARHVVTDAERVRVSSYTATSYPNAAATHAAEVVARAKSADLALLRFASRDASFAPVPLCPARKAPSEDHFPCLLVEEKTDNAPGPRLSKVLASKKVRKSKTDEPALVWEVDTEPQLGMSGGPLVDGRGLLLGICSGRSDGKGYYAHRDVIQDFLKAEGFAWLYEEEKRK